MLLVAACAGVPAGGQPAGVLGSVRGWAVQLQGLEEPFAWRRLEAAPVDMVVVDPVRSVRGMERFGVRELVRRVQRSGRRGRGRKLCLAYLNVGQAEDYRTYWQAGWSAPLPGRTGEPDFVLALDPDGWPGNYPVAYWDPRWQRALFGGPHAMLDQILEDGFDGVYLDWVLGYQEPAVVRAAAAAGVDPQQAMVDLIAALGAYARSRRPGFAVVAQNGVGLAEARPRLLEVIDGLAQEDLCFSGRAGAGWDDPASGDIARAASGSSSTHELGERLRRLRGPSMPVFTLDYAHLPDHVARAHAHSRALGFVPFVSRTPLDRLPSHVLSVGAAAPR